MARFMLMRPITHSTRIMTARPPRSIGGPLRSGGGEACEGFRGGERLSDAAEFIDEAERERLSAADNPAVGRGGFLLVAGARERGAAFHDELGE